MTDKKTETYNPLLLLILDGIALIMTGIAVYSYITSPFADDISCAVLFGYGIQAGLVLSWIYGNLKTFKRQKKEKEE